MAGYRLDGPDVPELRTTFREPGARAAQKVINHLDSHCRKFIAMSPFCVISTAGIDSLQNIMEQPRVGLLFFVPGMNETLRVKGRAEIVTAPELLAPLFVGGKPPISALRVTVEEAFLHCGRALIRSRLWDPEVQIERPGFPTYGQVLADQIAGADAAEIDASEDEANRNQLY